MTLYSKDFLAPSFFPFQLSLDFPTPFNSVYKSTKRYYWSKPIDKGCILKNFYWSMLIYNVVLVSGVQQSESVIHIHISILF